LREQTGFQIEPEIAELQDWLNWHGFPQTSVFSSFSASSCNPALQRDRPAAA
jgi:hypothetical protein